MQSGLVKSDSKKKKYKKKYFFFIRIFLAQSRYNKIIELRKQMAFARLGL